MMEKKKDVRASGLDKLVDRFYKELLKRNLTVAEVQTVTYSLLKKAKQNAQIS